MTTYQTQIKEQFDRMKGKDPDYVLSSLPLHNEQRELCGYLRPITKDYRKNMPEIGAIFAKWHNEHPTMSATPVVATKESTEKWLDEQILQCDDRMLFLVENLERKPVGHIGYSRFQFDRWSGEIDTALRGSKSPAPGIMTAALNTLILWGLKELKLEEITLRVLPDNAHAIAFYERNYFSPLQKRSAEEDPFLHLKLEVNEWLAAQNSN